MLRLIRTFCMLLVKELDTFIWETVIAYPNLAFLEISKIFVSCCLMVSVVVSKAEEIEGSTGGRLILSSRRIFLIPFCIANVQWQFPVSLFLWSMSGRLGDSYRLRKTKKLLPSGNPYQKQGCVLFTRGMYCRGRDGYTHWRDGEGQCTGIREARMVMAFIRLAYLFRKKK